MKKILLFALLFAASGVFAQSAKIVPPSPPKQHEPWELKLNPTQKASVPPAENPFGLPTGKRRPLPAFSPLSATTSDVRITRGENGLPILFEGTTEASANTGDVKTGALDYLASLQPAGIDEPYSEFVVKSAETDQLGHTHVRLEQVYLGVPVYGGEVIAHLRNGAFESLNGRYYPTPQLASVKPAVDAARAIESAKQSIGLENIKTPPADDNQKLLHHEPFTAELIVYHHHFQLNNERLAWYVEAHPNPLKRLIYLIDAQTGEVIHHFDYTCQIDGGRAAAAVAVAVGSGSSTPATDCQPPLPPATATATATATFLPPVTGSGNDLLGINRTFGVWQ